MTKKEIKLLKEFIANMRIPQAMPYSSDPEWDSGADYGREDAADELKYLLKDKLNIDLGDA